MTEDKFEEIYNIQGEIEVLKRKLYAVDSLIESRGLDLTLSGIPLEIPSGLFSNRIYYISWDEEKIKELLEKEKQLLTTKLETFEEQFKKSLNETNNFKI